MFLIKYVSYKICLNISQSSYSPPQYTLYFHFEEKKLSHQLQSGSRFNYKVAQLENYKVAQKNYKVAQKLQSGAK